MRKFISLPFGPTIDGHARSPNPDRVRPIPPVRNATNTRERPMSTTIDATYDGQVFRPAGAVLLEPNTSVRLTIEALAAGAAKDYPEADFYKPVE
jgi:hypothetical protein